MRCRSVQGVYDKSLGAGSAVMMVMWGILVGVDLVLVRVGQLSTPAPCI